MTRDETNALWAKCESARKAAFERALAEGCDQSFAEEHAHEAARLVWNAWAEDMFRRRRALEQTGNWAAARDRRGDLQPENDATRSWFRLAAADFSHARFDKPAEVQPPAGLVAVAGDRARFSGFVFPGLALFRETCFAVTVWFEKAIFHGNASFEEASFERDAWFEHSVFAESSSFDETGFAGDAWFDGATFSKSVSFLQASFRGYTTFSDVRFARSANFTAISGERAFQLAGARFETEPPSFFQADFKKAPRFDNVHVPLPRYFARGDSEHAARYRILRQLADAGLDHQRERTFFKGEVRSRRWVEDKPWDAAFLLGLAYDAFSDFGRSIVVPVALWLTSIAVAAALYLAAANASAAAGKACQAQTPAPLAQSLFLSLKNGLVFFAGNKDHRVNQAYQCLFGGPEEAPSIPLAVTLGELVHMLWSAVLIFLMLLAVRNQFRIR